MSGVKLSRVASRDGTTTYPSRHNGEPTNVDQTWADEFSQYIKSLDPQHMVTFGGYGYLNDAAARTSNGPNSWDFNYDGASVSLHPLSHLRPMLGRGNAKII